MAFVSFLDGQRQWFKSRIGLDITEAPRENSFCSHTVSQKGVFVVEDAASDARFARNPLVTSSSKVRFLRRRSPLYIRGRQRRNPFGFGSLAAPA